MVDRLGRVGAYSGRAGAGLVGTQVQAPDTVDPAEALKGYFDREKRAAAARDGLRSVKAEADFQTRYLQYQNTLDPMSPSYMADIKQWSEDNTPTSLDAAGFETDEAKTDYQMRLARFSGSVSNHAAQAQADAMAQTAITTRTDAQNDALTNIRNDPGNAAAYLEAFRGQSERLNAGIPAVARAKMDRAFADEATLTQAEGMAMSGDIRGARDFLKGATGVAPDAVRAMGRRINEIENQNEQERSKALTGLYADVLEGVYSGRFSEPGQLDQPEYAELWRERPTARVELRERIRNEQKRKVAEARSAADAARKAAAGMGAGYSQHDSDLAWGNTMLDMAGKDVSPTDYMKALASHVYSYTTVPSIVKQQFDRAELSGDENTLAQSAEVEQFLRETFPAAKTGAGPIYSVMAGLQKTYGMDSLQAAREALKQRSADPNVIKGNEEEQNAVLKAEAYDPRKSAAAAFDVDASLAPPEVVFLYDTVFKDQMKRNGNNSALASTVAKEEVSRRYLPGLTTVGGVERLVPFAPEAQIAQGLPAAKSYIPLLGDAVTGHLKEMLTGKIRPYAPEGGDPWDVIDEQPPVRLMATKATEDAIRGGRRPEYEIQQRVPGGYIPVTDAQGRPVTYALPDWDELKAYPVIRDKIASDTARVRAISGNSEEPDVFFQYGAP